MSHKSKNITKQQPESPTPRKDRLDAMLDEPVRNERYGGQTMREVVLRAFVRDERARQRKPKRKLKA